jgi:hypothetical protein
LRYENKKMKKTDKKTNEGTKQEEKRRDIVRSKDGRNQEQTKPNSFVYTKDFSVISKERGELESRLTDAADYKKKNKHVICECGDYCINSGM